MTSAFWLIGSRVPSMSLVDLDEPMVRKRSKALQTDLCQPAPIKPRMHRCRCSSRHCSGSSTTRLACRILLVGYGIIANTVSPINNQRAEFDHIQSATRTNNKIHPAVPFSNCHQAIKEGTHTFPSIPVQARNNQLELKRWKCID